jgi:hypothetical protein
VRCAVLGRVCSRPISSMGSEEKAPARAGVERLLHCLFGVITFHRNQNLASLFGTLTATIHVLILVPVFFAIMKERSV